jgi:hypothetical protein
MCMCVMGTHIDSFVSVTMIFLLDFETVLTVWQFSQIIDRHKIFDKYVIYGTSIVHHFKNNNSILWTINKSKPKVVE